MKTKFYLSLIVLTLIMPLFINVKTVKAEELSAKKESIKNLEKDGEYDIQISVPGEEKKVIEGYNIIFMLDASSSMNGTRWNNVKKAILSATDILLPSDNKEENVNKIAILSFGVSSHVNVELTNDKNIIKNALPNNSGQSLLNPGRSATNNEVGLSGIREYLNSLDETLTKDKEHTYVVYLTDGESNANEKEIDWYNQYLTKTNLINNIHKNFINIIKYIENFTITDYPEFINNLINNIKSLDTTKNTATEIISLNNHTEEINALFDESLCDYLELIGYDINNGIMSMSSFEKLVTKTKYSNNYELNIIIENFGYYILSSESYSKLENANRAVIEGNKLKEYATIYTISYTTSNRNDSNKILDPNFAGNGDYTPNTPSTHYSSGFYKSGQNAEEINKIFENLLYKLTYINYNNSKVIDYTSKWVIPKDINGDGVFDENDIIVKYNNNIINANIKVEKLTKEEISKLNDNEVTGNTYGDIYRITWYITDKFKYNDNYILIYKVDVDINEENFEFNKNYKANGDTKLIYDIIETIDNKEEIIEKDITYNIKVPEVIAKNGKLIVIYQDEDGNELSQPLESTKQIGNTYKTNAKDIPGYELSKINGEVEGVYVEGTTKVIYIYKFVGGKGGDVEELPPETGIIENIQTKKTNNNIKIPNLFSILNIFILTLISIKFKIK